MQPDQPSLLEGKFEITYEILKECVFFGQSTKRIQNFVAKLGNEIEQKAEHKGTRYVGTTSKIEDLKKEQGIFMGLIKECYEFRHEEVWFKLLEKEVKVDEEHKFHLERVVVYGEIIDGKMKHFEEKIQQWGIDKYKYSQLLTGISLSKEIVNFETKFIQQNL